MWVKIFAAFGLGSVLLLGAAGAAKADPKDFRFEAVQQKVAASPTATVALRLVHLPDGKPVTNAILFQPKMEMPMAGMAPMVTKVTAGRPDGQGVYPFTTDFSDAGPWTLTVSAKIQGEPATLVGSVTFIATPMDHGKMGGMDHGH